VIGDSGRKPGRLLDELEIRLGGSKRQTRMSETAKVTSVVHSAIQRELRRAASSSPRLT